MTARRSDALAPAWSAGRRVSEMGEFPLLARIRRWLGDAPRGPEADRGAPRGRGARAARGALAGRGAHVAPGRDCVIGDDAALLRPPPGWDLVLTCDIQIEGRHFERRWLTPRALGARVAEVNLSDIAAMGALPVAALVSLGIPGDLTLPALRGIYAGLRRSLDAYGAAVAGGNLSSSPRLLIDVTLVGCVEPGCALRRCGARPGDLVCVTGHPGRAGAALAGPRPALVAPRARIDAGRFLLENRIATSAIDLSDGLGGDLRHLCEESGVGIVISASALPLHRSLVALARRRGEDARLLAAGPSDDYELIFTAPRRKIDLALAMGPALGMPVAIIGRVVEGPARVAWQVGEGAPRAFPQGWDHLGALKGKGRRAWERM